MPTEALRRAKNLDSRQWASYKDKDLFGYHSRLYTKWCKFSIIILGYFILPVEVCG